MVKCINCTKLIQCSLDKTSKEGKHNCSYFEHREEHIVHIPLEKVREMLDR